MFHGLGLGSPLLADNGLEILTNREFWAGLSMLTAWPTNSPRDEAFVWFSQRGGYPLVHQRADVYSGVSWRTS